MAFSKSQSYPPLIAAIATALLAAITMYLTSGMNGNAWGGLDLAKAALENEYCEHNRMGDFVRQPVNSWSNLCYFFLGAWAISWAVMDYRATTIQKREFTGANPLRRFPAMTTWIGLMLMGLCIGSFFFHASLTRLGQHWDMTFTYGLSMGLNVMAGHRLAVGLGMQENARNRGLWLLLAMALTVLMYVIKWWLNGRIALPLMIMVGIGLLMAVYLRDRAKFNGWYLLAGFLAIVFAGIFRFVDVAKTGCAPEGWLQLHALWHVCTGLAGFLFLAFLREEKE